jgi:hypothetical protein
MLITPPIIDIILKIDWLMSGTTCLVSLVSTESGCCKNPLEEQVQVAGTKPNLSNLLFLDIYASTNKTSYQK